MAKIRIRLFGAFREFGRGAEPKHELELELGDAASISVRELRPKLVARIAELRPAASHESCEKLVAAAAFGSERAILADDARIEGGASVAVLPPVCGG